MPERRAPEECANCGAAIPRNASACPECGADERTGWRDDDDATRYDGLDLPESAFEDDDAPSAGAPRAGSPTRSSERSPRPLRRGLAWYWILVAALLVAGLVLGLVSFR